MDAKKKQVLVFGVFDGCDEGHQYFLRKASALGDNLIVVVTQDDMVEELKAKCAVHTLAERIAAIKKLGLGATVVPGDMEKNNWEIVRKFKPSIIALGHDQQALQKALEEDMWTFSFPVTLYTIGKQ